MCWYAAVHPVLEPGPVLIPTIAATPETSLRLTVEASAGSQGAPVNGTNSSGRSPVLTLDDLAVKIVLEESDIVSCTRAAGASVVYHRIDGVIVPGDMHPFGLGFPGARPFPVYLVRRFCSFRVERQSFYAMAMCSAEHIAQQFRIWDTFGSILPEEGGFA